MCKPSTSSITRVFIAGPGKVARSFLLATCVCVIVGGCASSHPRPVRTEIQPFSDEEKAAWDRASGAEYRMRRGDVFDVFFDFNRELDQSDLTVLPDGRVSLPRIDSVKAVGLTISELDSALTSAYAVEYLQPDLSIVIRQLGELGVYVLGNVMMPDYVVLPQGHANILSAIALAGGFAGDASSGEVLHIRVTPDGYQYRHLDLSHLEKRAFMSPEVIDLQMYDIIFVPQSAMGDIVDFQHSVMGGLLSMGDLFWDVYALTNIDQVQTLVR